MDRRKKRTSLNQYLMYIKKLEDDSAFRSGIIPSNEDVNFINNKWKDLANKLNTCNNGPSLSPEEWKKRLNDWKNSTRCKYRRTLAGEKDIHLSPLEMRALNLFGKIPGKSNNNSISTKNDSDSIENDDNSGEEEERLAEDERKYDGLLIEPIPDFGDITDQTNTEDECADIPEIKRSGRSAKVPVNGEVPSKKSRLEEITSAEVFEKAPYTPVVDATEAQAIAIQLKRIADTKVKKLQFEIAKFKFRNPGFDFTINNAS